MSITNLTGLGLSPAVSSTANDTDFGSLGGQEVVVLIIYYRSGDNMRMMADAAKRGLETVENLTAEIFQIPEDRAELDSEEPHIYDYPALTPDLFHKVADADGILLGIPGELGLAPTPVKAFFDELAASSVRAGLVGKPAGMFTSSSYQGAGQETTIWTTITVLASLGMIFVPTGYGFGPDMFDLKQLHGGSPFGAGTIAGPDGLREPSRHELDYAQYQGSYFGLVAKRFRR